MSPLEDRAVSAARSILFLACTFLLNAVGSEPVLLPMAMVPNPYICIGGELQHRHLG